MPASTDTEPGTAPPPSPLPEGSQGGLSAEDVGCSDAVAHGRLSGLLNYIAEQLRDVDPRAFRIDSAGAFVLRPTDLSSLPGVKQDLKAEGDHVWLRVERLEATRPPTIAEAHQGIVRVLSDPEGAEPRIDDAAFKAKLARAGAGLPEDARRQLEERSRVQVEQALEDYRALWKSWAEGERPRRRTIQLYADLFALKHTLEAAETARPIELVCGIAVLSWQLRENHDQQLFETGEAPDLVIHFVTRHATPKCCQRKVRGQLCEDQLLGVQGDLGVDEKSARRCRIRRSNRDQIR